MRQMSAASLEFVMDFMDFDEILSWPLLSSPGLSPIEILGSPTRIIDQLAATSYGRLPTSWLLAD